MGIFVTGCSGLIFDIGFHAFMPKAGQMFYLIWVLCVCEGSLSLSILKLLLNSRNGRITRDLFATKAWWQWSMAEVLVSTYAKDIMRNGVVSIRDIAERS